VAVVVAKAFAYLVVGLRFPLILGWAAAVAAAVLFLPPLPSSGSLSDLIPAGSAAAQADATAARLCGYPLEAGIAVVQRAPRRRHPGRRRGAIDPGAEPGRADRPGRDVARPPASAARNADPVR
jgi:hypothetical protein